MPISDTNSVTFGKFVLVSFIKEMFMKRCRPVLCAAFHPVTQAGLVKTRCFVSVMSLIHEVKSCIDGSNRKLLEVKGMNLK